MPKTIRTDKWSLRSTDAQRVMVRDTLALYRAYVRALVGVIWVHEREINQAQSACFAVERLIHATKKNPAPRYRYFGQKFKKFPSYLRRVAIEAALGQVSSFSSRYRKWASGMRGKRTAKPPRRTAENLMNPSLYRGQCVKFNDDHTVASIKLWSGSDWIWSDFPITARGKRHAVSRNKALSPALMANGRRVQLAVPFEGAVELPAKKQVTRVCGVDLGINTTAVASIVTEAGTVVSRQFFHRGADIDRRDKGLRQISKKASLTMGRSGRLCEGFCAPIYAKAHRRNRDMINRLSGEILAFAQAHGASAIVLEHMKGFRPRGGRRHSTLRQRFHGWLHRKLSQKLAERATEAGMLTAHVTAAGTSKYAFDGSGIIRRDENNRALATFQNGKRYNADLSASYNIAARFFAKVLGLNGRRASASASGKSSRAEPRIPVTLSTLWLHAQARLGGDSEAATTSPQGV